MSDLRNTPFFRLFELKLVAVGVELLIFFINSPKSALQTKAMINDLKICQIYAYKKYDPISNTFSYIFPSLCFSVTRPIDAKYLFTLLLPPMIEYMDLSKLRLGE